MRGPSLAREGPVSLEDSSTMTDNLKVTWILCSWKPPTPHTGEGQVLVLRARMSPGFLSAAVGRPAAPVACVHSRQGPDVKGVGLSAARGVALEMEISDSRHC